MNSISNMKQKFTVEQFELIRRLRNSGVTCQQIIESFQAFERIDAELGALFANPIQPQIGSQSIPSNPISAHNVSQMVNILSGV